MPKPMPPAAPSFPVFDGHNDLLLRLFQAPERREDIWLTGEGKGHLDLPRMRAGGFVGGFFAIYVPSPQVGDVVDWLTLMDSPPYSLPMPPLMDHLAAQPAALSMAAHMMWMESASAGQFRICRDLACLNDSLARGVIAGVMHMEGAEAIDPDLTALHQFHALGLRSLGPVWSRPTIFGHGVPFTFPGTPDTGPGLTEAGKRLVRECNALGVMLDLSHLNAAGFDDVAAISDAPLVATHSNAWAITPSSRNLTDRQLTMIRESGGMVGLNFATVFLREDGRENPGIGWEPMLRHLDYLITALGEDHVGFGSDFDGATVPAPLADVAGLPRLTAAMQAHGFGDALMRKLCCDNWLALLGRVWKA